MALVHADNFSNYGDDESFMLDGIYAEVGPSDLVDDPDGISGGKVIAISYSGGGAHYSGFRYVLGSAQTKVGIAMRVYFNSLPGNPDVRILPIQWRDISNDAIATLTMDTTGRLYMRQGSYNGTVVASTAAPVIAAGSWYHIEAYIDTSAQECELRVEGGGGNRTISADSLSFSGTPAQLFCGQLGDVTGDAHGYYVKDYVVWDGTGSDPEDVNDFIGSCLVASLVPTSDVDLNWTPSTGSTAWEILSNVPPSDTEYISAPYNAGAYQDPCVVELSDLPTEATSVKGLISFVRAAKSDGGDGSLQVSVISDPDGTPATASGGDRPITTSQSYWRDVFQADPATSAPWTPAAVNDVRLQLDRTT